MKKLLSLIIALVLVFSICICFSSCTEKHVEEANNTSAPTATTSNAVNKPTNNRYYMGTNVPDYTYVTGIEQKRSPYYTDNGGVLYIYRNTKSGEYSEMTDYIKYLLENGWSLLEKKADGTSLAYSYVKGESFVMVNFAAENDEVLVVPLED